MDPIAPLWQQHPTFGFWVQVLQAVIVPMGGYGIWILRSIRDELHQLNNRVVVLEQWHKDHDPQGDGHRVITEQVRGIRADITKLERSISAEGGRAWRRG